MLDDGGPVRAEAARSAAGRGRAALALGWAVAASIALADWLSGIAFDVSLTYVFPVAWLAWRASRASGTWLAAVCAVGDTAVDVHLGRYPSSPSYVAWNAGLQFLLMALAAWAVARVERAVRTERALRERLAIVARDLDAEMGLVGKIQASLLPASPPAVAGLAIATHYAPSARAGGDYYDFFPLSEGRVGVLVADASGHGPAAAVLMTMARVLFHAVRQGQDRPDRVLDAVNAGLVDNILLAHFVTACYAVVDPRRGTVEFSLAGHPLPILRRARDGTASELGHPTSPPLGLEPAARHVVQTASLEPGDTLVFATDGLAEARGADGDLLGDERVLRGIASSAGAGPDATIAGLLRLLADHLGSTKAEDDVTLVVVQATDTAAPPPR